MTAQQQFDQIDQTWSQFTDTTPSHFQMGPYVVSLDFATPSLTQKIARAFDHLKIALPIPSDFTIRLWDASEIGGKLPPLEWNMIFRNGYRGYCEPPYYFHYFPCIGAISFLNTEQNKAYYVVRSGKDLPWWVSGSPLQPLLHAWFRERGLQLTHSAAISDGQSALLLAGKGGSGKSTTVLTCLTEGMHYLGEDYCLLKPGSPPQVYSIYQSAKWQAHTRKLFPNFDSCIINKDTADTEKALIYYEDIFPKQIKSSSPIRALVSLTVGSAPEPSLQLQDPRAALRDLMMSTLLQLPFFHSQTMTLLDELSSQLPCYQLTLGTNFKSNTHLIRQLLK